MDAAATAARGLLAKALLAEVAAALGRERIDVLPLKGALMLGLDVPGSDTRYLGDVDVLVPRARIEDAVRALERAGLRRVARASHAVTMWSERHRMHLDLHERLFPRGWFRLREEDVFRRATADDRRFGAPVLVMSARDLYAHLVGHFLVGRHNATDARHVADFGVVATHFALDARDVARHLDASGLARAARYTLRETAVGAHRGFARDVLAALPRDRAGDALALVTHSVLTRWPGSARPGAVVSRLYWW